jgi:threonine dehydratase
VTAVEPLDVGIHRRIPVASGWPAAPAPSPTDLSAAAQLIRELLVPTPMLLSEPLSRRFERSVYVKLELLSPIRSFKHRGAVAAVQGIARDTGARVVVTASTGNHGQGVAYAGRLAGLEVVVFAPETITREKLDAMRRLGADVRVGGPDLDHAQKAAEAATGPEAIYLEDGENAELMAGAATVMSEMLDEQPDLDTVVVPIGGGNLIGGSLLAVAARGSDVSVVGVQSQAASGSTRSWLEGLIVESTCTTFAGGLATTRPGRLALAVMVDLLETVAIVSDEDLYAAMGTMVAAHGIHLEGAAAASIAVLERFHRDIPGDVIGLVLTGNWVSADELSRAVDHAEASR